MKKYLMVFGIIFSSTLLAGGTWEAIGDVPSFPDGQPQITRGPGELSLITGATSIQADPRNAYCIKITDPADFVATTDNDINNAANTDFDTRLFLFDKNGQPILFNDDTAPNPSKPFPSTLTGVTNDGSGFVLTQPGEYILVVAGFPDKPLDNIASDLFNIGNTTVNTANPNVGKFSAWENNSPATGDYLVALEGVSHCQDKLDIVGTTEANNTKLCIGDGNGGFGDCNNDSISSAKSRLTTGYLDGDEFIDVIFDDYLNDVPSVCLGDGNGGYKSCSVFIIGTNRTRTPVLGDLNNDQLMDVVFLANSENHQACLGDGTGQITGCTDVPNSEFIGSGQLALINNDQVLDLVYTTINDFRTCLGNGTGGFNTCLITEIPAGTVEIADVNQDGMNDVISLQDSGTNRVCINVGSGQFSCSDINSQTNRSRGLAVSDLNNDGHIDLVIANVIGSSPGVNKVCLGDGNGAFTCNDVSGVGGDYVDVKLGLLNNDNFLDAVFAGNGFSRTCMGNGDGTFSNCINDTNLNFSRINLGEFNADAIFNNGFE